MYPIIKSASGAPLAVMNNIVSNSLKRKINADYTFDFKCFKEDFKTEHIKFDNLVFAAGQTFDINYIDEGHSSGVDYDVKCEHVFYRLIKDKLDNYANTGTPADILAHILQGTEFTVGTIDFTAPIVFAVNRNTNKMSLVIAMANALGGELDFSNEGFAIDIKQTIGTDNGYQIRIKKNLEQINKIVDRRGDLKATYKIGLIDIFKSDEMILKGLKDLETLGLGDKANVVDETINVDVSLFVVEEERDVIKSEKINVVLGDSFDYLSDDISYIKSQAIKQSDIIYGVKINNAVGIEIERADKMARTKLNADEFRMQTGDGSGSYIDALYFDPINGQFVFTGKIIGGTIQIGEGFSVDENGNLTSVVTDGLSSSVSSMSSSITQLANEIELKVSNDQYSASVIVGMINNASAVSINADKINLNGVTTMSGLAQVDGVFRLGGPLDTYARMYIAGDNHVTGYTGRIDIVPDGGYTSGEIQLIAEYVRAYGTVTAGNVIVNGDLDLTNATVVGGFTVTAKFA